MAHIIKCPYCLAKVNPALDRSKDQSVACPECGRVVVPLPVLVSRLSARAERTPEHLRTLPGDNSEELRDVLGVLTDEGTQSTATDWVENNATLSEYRAALSGLSRGDQLAITALVEHRRNWDRIAKIIGKRSRGVARMVVLRALKRLKTRLHKKRRRPWRVSSS